ncbi:MAG: UDPGP type 1 family protein [Kiritimatiellia bacterium]|jgi:UDP-N-acetylglucosamine/UDP-N-acetylgalactosamine diphosphorylase|nr:UDPGP type 1 family protein [Kiritimatiellia bacterium]
MAFSYDDALSKLREEGQEHLLAFWGQLDEAQQEGLLAQIEEIDFSDVGRMRAALKQQEDGAAASLGEFGPAPVVKLDETDDPDVRELGFTALRAGKVGALLVAGGQGSRLGYDGPKGCYEIGPVSNASLFEIHSRKILALEKAFDTEVPFYIMTSEANDTPTREFFESNDYFGLAPDRVIFFTQGMWPGLMPDGNLLLDRPDHVFVSPDGHGGILAALRKRGVLQDMSDRGLSTLFYFQVDNPLIEIADPDFIGLHLANEAEISVKVCAKRDASEGLGVVVSRGDCSEIIEYSDLTDAQKEERTPDGQLKLLYGSVAIHIFTLGFLQRESDQALPLHVAHKKVPCCDESGNIISPDNPNAYKFEKFIFDVLPDAERALNVEFAREEEFSPVKNAEGNDSPATTTRDMIAKWARWFDACGVAVPRDADGTPTVNIEIDPCYALNAEDLKAKLPADFKIDGDVLLRG